MNKQNCLYFFFIVVNALHSQCVPCVQPEINMNYSVVVLVGRNTPVSAGDLRDTGSIPGLGGSRGGGHGNPLQYSCLENPMDRGAWQATVHSVPELDKIEVT